MWVSTKSSILVEENAVKRHVTRFQMHQALKLHQRKIQQISRYDPLDMFSGSRDRVRKAFDSLFLTPQNNFRVFLNGSLIFGGMGNVADITSCTVNQAFDDALKRIIQAKDGLPLTSGLLDRLLEVQKLDSVDIEGAIHAYFDIISQPCLVCQGKGENELPGRYSHMHSLDRDEGLNTVRNYLISATGKDLSMMISFKPRENVDVNSLCSSVHLESTNQYFNYKASFIDLDMKPLKKMEYYYELDQHIVSSYSKLLKDEKEVTRSG